MTRRTAFNVGKYLLAFGLLGWVVYKNWLPGSDRGLEYVWRRHVVEGRPVHTGFLLAALVTYAAALLLTFAHWYILVRAQGLPFRPFDALRLGLIGLFFNNFLPSSVGGDVVKAAYLVREQSRRTAAVTTVLMDRVVALWGLFWFVALIGVAFWLTGRLDGPGAEPSRWIVGVAAGTVAVSAVVWVLLGFVPEGRAERFGSRLGRLRRVGGPAVELWQAVWVYRRRPGSVALALVTSCVGFVGFVLTYYFCVRTVWDAESGARIPTLAEHFLLVPVGMVIGATPLFPGGAGIAEAGFAALYQWYGCHTATGMVGMLVQRALTLVLGLFGLAAFLGLPARVAADEASPSTPEAASGDEVDPLPQRAGSG